MFSYLTDGLVTCQRSSWLMYCSVVCVALNEIFLSPLSLHLFSLSAPSFLRWISWPPGKLYMYQLCCSEWCLRAILIKWPPSLSLSVSPAPLVSLSLSLTTRWTSWPPSWRRRRIGAVSCCSAQSSCVVSWESATKRLTSWRAASASWSRPFWPALSPWRRLGRGGRGGRGRWRMCRRLSQRPQERKSSLNNSRGAWQRVCVRGCRWGDS